MIIMNLDGHIKWVNEIREYVGDISDKDIVKLSLAYTLQSLRNNEDIKRLIGGIDNMNDYTEEMRRQQNLNTGCLIYIGNILRESEDLGPEKTAEARNLIFKAGREIKQILEE